jgi:hypothetical protein
MKAILLLVLAGVFGWADKDTPVYLEKTFGIRVEDCAKLSSIADSGNGKSKAKLVAKNKQNPEKLAVCKIIESSAKPDPPPKNLAI